MSVAVENNAEAWAALSMVREALEVLGPVGAVPRGEEFTMTFMDEAEALVAGVEALADTCLPRAPEVLP